MERRTKDSFLERLDSFGRRHLWLTALAVGALALAATLALLSHSDVTAVVYEGF